MIARLKGWWRRRRRRAAALPVDARPEAEVAAGIVAATRRAPQRWTGDRFSGGVQDVDLAHRHGPDVGGAAIRRAEEQERREFEAAGAYGPDSVQAEVARLGL